MIIKTGGRSVEASRACNENFPFCSFARMRYHIRKDICCRQNRCWHKTQSKNYLQQNIKSSIIISQCHLDCAACTMWKKVGERDNIQRVSRKLAKYCIGVDNLTQMQSFSLNSWCEVEWISRELLCSRLHQLMLQDTSNTGQSEIWVQIIMYEYLHSQSNRCFERWISFFH